MHIEAPEWDDWEASFLEIADKVEKVKSYPGLNNTSHYVCLYGDNGLTPEQEFEELATMRGRIDEVRKLEVESFYWQDIVLFIP